jgi:ferredoxin
MLGTSYTAILPIASGHSTDLPYFVNDQCINCKYQDCVEVCPTDAFYEGENMLVIMPDKCISCGVCEPECPVDAIIQASGDDTSLDWVKLNERYSRMWPHITCKGTVPKDADTWKNVAGKLSKYFSSLPSERYPQN